jgi:hypothetical protein
MGLEADAGGDDLAGARQPIFEEAARARRYFPSRWTLDNFLMLDVGGMGQSRDVLSGAAPGVPRSSEG